VKLIWEQEAAASNPAIPTGHGYFSNTFPCNVIVAGRARRLMSVGVVGWLCTIAPGFGTSNLRSVHDSYVNRQLPAGSLRS
jgi:hypothetical protein